MGDDSVQVGLRALPAVDRLVDAVGGRGVGVTAAARRAIDEARAAIRGGGPAPTLEDLAERVRHLLRDDARSLLQPVINATGVLIHTNLGRAPLGEEQLAAVLEVASGYSNLEYDVAGGRRGTRYAHATALISALTGAEEALVVNNNAAAVLVTLASLCAGREVIISRGELIEIGGEFRIPDVMAASGAKLVEVGTTNRTHIGDYEKAITPDTAAILKVHPSNYRVVGFTAEVAPRDLGRLAVSRGLSFIHDLGSGLVMEDASLPEPLVRDALEDGADVVTFSGDKLLGGPQAGVIAGRARAIGTISHHPLLRTLRPDKMTLAALEATLRMYLEGRGGELPLWQMASVPLERLEERARKMSVSVAIRVSADVKVEPLPLSSVAGGGSLPGVELSSFGLSILSGERSAAELQRGLRYGDVPVIARVEDDRLILDLRTVPASEDDRLLALLLAALSG
ncbi:MAG: L-seryl-tRNA(Sec) selenium transferase [Actinomycetota bacterium]|nr:L-seryl-tRNA(Sec) selenium transferase [Actinomycetota bacterium]